MSRKKSRTGLSGVVQVVVSLVIVIAATAGAGHSGVASPRPPTVCAQLRVLSGAFTARHIL
jgi:hypothetical protein